MTFNTVTTSDGEADGLDVRLSQPDPFHMDTTLTCAPGKLLALVGPSGSGKSTVLRSIAGLYRTTHAHIRCNGVIWHDSNTGRYSPPQQRRVGLVFQEYALFPHKTALENVMLAISGNTRQERQAKAMTLLERTNMTGLEKRMPSTLSGGQKQRVAIARALAREPSVLLLDEPFSAVDQQTRRKLYRELAALRQSLELPIVLVTHDLNEVQLLADSLCLMHRGTTLQQGAVANVINRPRSRAIARLVGHQNLFNATVVGIESEHTVFRLGEVAAVRGPLLPNARINDEASLLFAPSAIRLDTSTANSNSHTASKSDNLEARFSGTVQESVILGDELSIRLHLDRIPKSLRFKIPLHTALNRCIEQGIRLNVRVQYEGIHAMTE